MTAAQLSQRASVIRQAVKDGLAWWVSELRGMVPQWVLDRLVGAGDRGAILELGRDQASLLVGPNGKLAASSIPLAAEAIGDVRARLHATIRAEGLSNTVAIRLASDVVFEAELKLPLSAERSLRQIVQNQLGKLTPLDPRSVRFAYRVVERVSAARLLKLKVIIAKQATIDRALALARSVGLHPNRITAEAMGPAVNAGAAFLLWQADPSGSMEPRRRLWLRVLEMVAITAFIATYGLYIHRLDKSRADLRAAVASAKRMAAATQAIAVQTRQLQSALGSVAARRGGAVPLKVLDELTRLVPEDSWVFQLALHGHAVEMTGYSPHAADMISRIEGSALFEKPRFRSPITLGPDGRSEQFSLSFDVKSAAAP